MKLFSEDLQTLRALYIAQLKKALDLEQQIVAAMPTMIDAATDTQLKQAFQSHLQETESQVERVAGMLTQLTGAAGTSTCKVGRALVAEAQDGIKDAGNEVVRDITLIAAAQQVEHHEIAVYGTLKTWAKLLGEAEQAATLEQIEGEEKHADMLLSTVSDRVNAEQPVAA